MTGRRDKGQSPAAGKGAQNKQLRQQTVKQQRAHYAAKYPARKR
jgi:hypothetical protein